MNYNEIAIDYIDTKPKNEPIFLEEIRNYILDYIKKNSQEVMDEQSLYNNINVIINRMNKNDKIKTFTKGIYYKPTINPLFGEMPLDTRKIIDKRYLKDENGKRIGFVTGPKLYNWLGLTTQLPNWTYIITNNCNKKNNYDVQYLRATIIKPDIEINDENWLYLQLIEILINKYNVNIEVDNYNEIIYKYMQKNGLTFEKLIKYARETNNRKIMDQLFELAR